MITFSRLSIKFQGHAGQKIDDLAPSWALFFKVIHPISRSHRPNKFTRPVAAIRSLRFALFMKSKSMAKHKTAVTPLLMHWSYCSLAHYCDIKMGAMASQITSLTIVYSIVYSGTDQRNHQSSTSLAFVPGIHRWPLNSPHKWPVTRKMLTFDDIIMANFTRSAHAFGDYTFNSTACPRANELQNVVIDTVDVRLSCVCGGYQTTQLVHS